MEQRQREFSGFYESARDDCLRIVLINVGDRQLAEDLVAEAFTRAWTSWRKVRQHPAPRAWVVRTALNAHVSWWQLRDGAGLQSGLCADGIPVTSRFPGTRSRSARLSRRSPRLPAGAHVGPGERGTAGQDHAQSLPAWQQGARVTNIVILIRPSAIPAGIGLNIYAWAAPAGPQGTTLTMESGLVQASPACTGP